MFDFESVEKEFSFTFDNLETKIVYLYYVERYSIRQVAKELDCTGETVRKVLHSTFGVRDKQKAYALRSTEEFKTKISKATTGEKNSNAILTELDVIAIRDKYLILLDTFAKIPAQQTLADEYNVKRPTISAIVLRHTWKHV